MTDLRKSALGHHSKRPLSGNSKPNFSPIKWSEYFDSEEDIEIESGKFHIYNKGDSGPILLCLHGGGYSGLSWALFAKDIFENIECQIKAVDLRGHGNTLTVNDNDLSLEALSQDVVDVAKILSDRTESPVVLIGHSMGGAVAVNASFNIDSVKGLCVIDVVEGTALDALSSMQSILRGRPSFFKSLAHAIQWCYKGGQTHNLEAARVSMPGQIINIKSGKLAADEWDTFDQQAGTDLSPSNTKDLMASEFTLMEVDEEVQDSCNECGKPPLPKNQKTEGFKVPLTQNDGPQYTWRIDLSKTEQYWPGWFKGLSEKFLATRIPKVLLLANIHGLDTALTVGQMQGKFQLQVLSRSGHAIHEDQPHNVSEIISGYLVKQKLAVPKPGYVSPPLPAC